MISYKNIVNNNISLKIKLMRTGSLFPLVITLHYKEHILEVILPQHKYKTMNSLKIKQTE